MAKQAVNIGTTANDGTGDPLRTAFDKINDNFDELYQSLGDGDDLSLTIDSDGNVDISADLTVDTNVLHVDSANNRVGIGTVLPSTKLNISDASNSYVLNETTGTGTSAGFRVKAGASAVYTLYTTEGVSQFDIYDNAVNATRMRIDSSGVVQVRNDEPILQLYNTDASQTLNQVLGGLEFYGTDPSGAGVGVRSAIRSISKSSVGSSYGLKFYTSSGTTNDVERMEILSGGDITFFDSSLNQAFYWDASAASLGIGTTSPRSILESKGTISIGDTQTTLGSDDPLSGIDFYTSDTSFASSNTNRVARIFPYSDDPFGQAFGLKFSTADTDTDAAIRMTIDSSGQVGIGTDSPFTNLTVYGATDSRIALINSNSGTTSSDGFVMILEDDSEVNFLNRESAAIKFATAGTERMRILSSGGITFNGDTAAANALDDYEEGTFSAALREDGGSTLFTDTDATYVKIGSIVHIEVQFIGGSTGGSGELRMNLPFAQTSNGGGGTGHYSVSNGGAVQHYTIGGTDYLVFTDALGSIASGNKIIGSDWGSSSRYYFSYTYSTI